MADPLLTSLCSICHVSAPKYKCPRCGIRTCSLPCVRKHKSWSDCSGERDPTVYRTRKELRTPAGIDHDYNFIHGMEMHAERTERELVEERGIIRAEELRHNPPTVKEVKWKVGRDGRRRRVVVTRELRETLGRTFEKNLAHRLRKLNVRILCAPMGMQRQKENRTTFNRKKGKVNWQVEWLGPADGARALSKVLEDVPLYRAYHQRLEDGRGRGAGSEARPHVQSTWTLAADVLQEPTTGRWVNSAEVATSGSWPEETDRMHRGAFDYFLASPRQRADMPRSVTKLEPDDCLGNVVRDTNVLEFPTIYVMERGAALPEGFVLRPKDAAAPVASQQQQRGTKRKDGPQKRKKKGKGMLRDMVKRRKGDDSQLEEGEVVSEGDGGGDGDEDDDDGDDSRSSVGTGGDDDDGAGLGLEAGRVLAEESFDEDEGEDEDDDDSTSSSGTDSDSDEPE